jgi:Cdc6-like AAA superfamily ATPase
MLRTLTKITESYHEYVESDEEELVCIFDEFDELVTTIYPNNTIYSINNGDKPEKKT